MLYVCSLITNEVQSIPVGSGWTIVRFPFLGESHDDWSMHQAQRVGDPQYTIADWRTDDRSGLIWPAAAGWGSITVNVHFEAGGYSKLRDQVIRDPLGYTSNPADTTGTDYRAVVQGTNLFTKHHEIFVDPGVPLAIRVGHNDAAARRITHAQFKLAINTDVARA